MFTTSAVRLSARRALAVASIAALAVAGLAGCAQRSDGTSVAAGNLTCNGVVLDIDYGPLEKAPVHTCLLTTSKESAKTLLAEAGYSVEGTVKYPDLALCRLGGLPSAHKSFALDGTQYTEPCTDFPPMNAYWGLWTRGNDGVWKMAEVGINDITLNPGDGLGLYFGDGSKFPTS